MTQLNCDLSFDPEDPYFPLPGNDSVRWALQIFTTSNGYGLDKSTTIQRTESDGAVQWHTARYCRLGQQAHAGSGSVDVRIREADGTWTFNIDAVHYEPIKSVKLILRGLPDSSPAAGWWSPTSPRGAQQTGSFQWNYPSAEWATKWAAAGETVLSIRDTTVSGAVLHVGTPAYLDETLVELVHSVPATGRMTSVVLPPIRLTLDATPGRISDDLTAHYAHLEKTFGLKNWTERQDVPQWARDISLVVTLHGQHWTGHVFNTFDEMVDLLDRVAIEVEPRRVLAYLPGWEGRYYYEYPYYKPGDDLGGEAGFRRLVDRAKELGVRLMPMFGANGANVTQYPRWEKAAIRNDTNRYPTMLNSPDWDGDRYPEGDQVFLNPGEPGFRRDLVGAISSLVEQFGVDAAFLDTASFWFNDPRYALYDGYAALVTELRELYPDLLLVSEGWWDAMMALFPMSQQWLGIERDIERPEFLTRYARTTSHLAEGTPGLGSTGVHEQGYRVRPPDRTLLGHLPVVSFAGGNGDQQIALLRTLTLIRPMDVESRTSGQSKVPRKIPQESR